MQAENEKLGQLFSQKEKEWNEFKRTRDGLTNGYVFHIRKMLGVTRSVAVHNCNDFSDFASFFEHDSEVFSGCNNQDPIYFSMLKQ